MRPVTFQSAEHRHDSDSVSGDIIALLVCASVLYHVYITGKLPVPQLSERILCEATRDCNCVNDMIIHQNPKEAAFGSKWASLDGRLNVWAGRQRWRDGILESRTPEAPLTGAW